MSTYTPQSAERWRLASQHLLDHCVRSVASRYRSVPVDARLVRGRTVAALLDAAREAQVLFIGGRHTDRRMSRLGWTASVLLARAPCVVEVVAGPSAALESDAESAVAGAVPPPVERTPYVGVWPTDYAYGSSS